MDISSHSPVGCSGDAEAGRLFVIAPPVNERAPSTTLKALDLFCGGGGASMGLHRAGFDVTGIDCRPQPRYPFRFIQGDALGPPVDLSRFDLIWASPPCQAYSVTAKIRDSAARHPDLVAPVREMLKASGVPYVIENVVGAPLENPAMLCGTMFGLKVFRHRLFETSFFFMAPCHPRHDGSTGASRGYSTLARGRNGYICVAGHNFIREEGAAAMGIDWMGSRHELAQAIPPAFSQFIAQAFLSSHSVQRAA